MKKKVKIKKTLRIQPHKFVSALERAEVQPKGLRIIQGYVGKASKKNSLRVYLDAELRRFVEIPASHIYHVEDQRTAEAPHNSVLFWVDEKARIQHFGHWIGSEDPTTMATGEEGGGDPTTMATGEEGGGLPNPLEALVNPFGTF